MIRSLLQRPRRLLLVVAVFLVGALFSAYLSVSTSDTPSKLRTHLQHVPSYLRNKACLLTPFGDHQVSGFLESATSVDDIASYSHRGENGNYMPPEFDPAAVNQAPRAKAAFVVLVRNNELDGMIQNEFRFNRKYNYPWIFLNDMPFTEEFKAAVRKRTRAPIYFGLVPAEHWGYPDWVDQNKAAQNREKMLLQDIPYAGSESYRHMCRFQSGFFFEHPLLYELGLEYYWRVEPYVHLFCDIDYDPFMFMQMNNKAYGFTMTLIEYGETIPTLWQHTKDFVHMHPEYLASDNALDFIVDNGDFDTSDYNLCHFWSNFEIGDLQFFRSKQYKEYFEYLDKTGGFFYERWGDAPVHSIAASLFLNKSQIYHFKDIGYWHDGLSHCPLGEDLYHRSGKCNCEPAEAVTLLEDLCMGDWWFTSKEGEPPERAEYKSLIDAIRAQEEAESEEAESDEDAEPEEEENSENVEDNGGNDKRAIYRRDMSALYERKRRNEARKHLGSKQQKWLRYNSTVTMHL